MFDAELVNATKRPSALIEPNVASAFPLSPHGVRLTHSVVCSRRSRTKICERLFVTGATFDAQLVNTTKRPSGEIDGLREGASASVPVELTLMRSSAPLVVSRTYTSGSVLPSLGKRSRSLWNAIHRPSVLSA